jgi:hypothetical protein
MGVFEQSVVNKNRPILLDLKDYQKHIKRNIERNYDFHHSILV